MCKEWKATFQIMRGECEACGELDDVAWGACPYEWAVSGMVMDRELCEQCYEELDAEGRQQAKEDDDA